MYYLNPRNGASVKTNPEWIACEIIRKGMTTTSVNKWWLEQYEKLTGVNLKDMLKKRGGK